MDGVVSCQGGSTGDPRVATLRGPYPAAGSGSPPAETLDWPPKVGPASQGSTVARWCGRTVASGKKIKEG
eukprot:6764785-Prorocentrum_lima.AAC.1